MDASHPKVDGARVMLPSGRQARLSVSIPPRIDGSVSFSLRVPQKRNTTLTDLVSFGSLTSPAATCLEVFMKVRRATWPGGGARRGQDDPGRGAVASRTGPASGDLRRGAERAQRAPPERRVLAELEVETLTDLIRSARVASPELIVLGELKRPEAWELLMAGTLGVGVVAAVHAEDTAGAFEALAVCATKAVPPHRLSS